LSIARNTLWGAFANGLPLIIGIASQVIIARILGAAALGEYYFIIILNNFVTCCLSFGIGLSNMTFVAKKEYPIGELNAGSLLYAFCFGILCVVLLALANFFELNLFGELNMSYVWLAFLMTPFTIYVLYWNYLMIGLEQIVFQSKTLLFFSIMWYGLNIVLVLSGYGLVGLLSAWVFYIISSFVFMLAVMLNKDKVFFRINSRLLKSALSFGLRGNLGEVSTQIWKRFNIFLLNYFYGTQVLGIYSVASELNEKFLLLPGPVRNAISHRITSSKLAEGSALTAKVTRHLFIWLLLVTCFSVFFAGLFIRSLYGDSFIESINPFRILLLGALSASIAPAISIFFLGQLKRPGLLSAIAAFTALVSVVLGLLLIPIYGIYGAAFAFSITCVVGLIISIYFFKKFSGYKVKEFFIVTREDLMDYKRFLTNFFQQFKTVRNG
jgi:O-antigen/teichoic acid export membrane protein